MDRSILGARWHNVVEPILDLMTEVIPFSKPDSEWSDCYQIVIEIRGILFDE